MLRGFYTAASGILMHERTLGVLTNNMANVNTPGYRASRVVSTTFDQEFVARLERNNGGVVGSGSPIRIVSDVPVRFDPSSMEETGRPFDVAINGEGFFNILVDDGQGGQNQYLTRNGNFDLDENGYLVLRGHGQVLGEKGPIQLNSSDITIEMDGSIYNERGRLVDKLLITDPTQGTEVELMDNGMYTVADMEANVQMDESTTLLMQGWTERNNIDLNQEYAMVMETQRAFQACSSALQIVDKINQKAASQIAAL